jgi:hypothetical protein
MVASGRCKKNSQTILLFQQSIRIRKDMT